MTHAASAKLRRVRAEIAPPTGTVTFVLADVEGSVALWESKPVDMAAASQQLDALVDDLVAHHGGARPVEQGEGDSFVAAFAIARDGLAFASDLQLRLAQDLPLRMRMSLHTGTAQLRDDANYMGPAVNRCARLRALAHGGQVLLSGATAALVADDLPTGVTLRDLGLHKLKDFDRHEHVFQLVHADLQDAFPPLRDEPIDSNLPASLTTFVAREGELTDLGRLLDEHRLVTLTGAGGCGKTRLAIEFARAQTASRYVDGVAWADAAPIGDGELVISCVAAALELRESHIEPLIDTVTRELADRKVLLILDNCEHVIDAAASVVDRILTATNHVRVLTTSREPLGIAGEIPMRIPSLDVDASCRLFEDRARATVPTLSWGSEAQRDVVDICTRLDGIPLAIELAAARVRVLTTRQIADGIADRFGLLAGGARTALPRQRTLEASVEWSYRLLSDDERTLLDRLSVFAGGFGLDAARLVCAADAVAGESVLDLLTALVDKSLVQVHEVGDGVELRYRLLETIRHFARQRLTDAADAERTRDHHLAYYLELAEAVAPDIERGSEVSDLAALSRLGADVDNFRVARDWAQQRGDGSRLLQLMAALWLFHEVRCDFEEATTWLRAALDAAPEPTATRALALYGLGDISLFVGDIPTVVSSGEEVVAIGELLDDPMIRMRGLLNLGWASSFGAYRQPEWGVEILSEILASLDGGDHAWLETDAAIGLSSAALTAGDLARATDAGRLAVASARRNGSAAALVRGTYYLGLALATSGHASEAETALRESIAIADDINDSFFKALGLATLAQVHWWLGRRDDAFTTSREALAISQRSGNPFALGMATAVLAHALADQGDHAAARATLDGADALFEQFEQLSLWFLTAGAAWARTAAVDDLDDARAQLTATRDSLPRAGRGPLSLYLGWLERVAGDDAAAEAAFTVALEQSTQTAADGDVVAALHELGVCAEARDHLERAVRLCAAAEAARTKHRIEPRPRRADLGSRPDDWERLRHTVGDDAFAAEWAAGSDLTLEQAKRFALRGKGGRRRPTTGWESLTPTELDVVRLVTEGLSNPAIADRMLITRGTVKVHLSHIFTKLGIASRAELAAEAVRQAAAS